MVYYRDSIAINDSYVIRKRKLTDRGRTRTLRGPRKRRRCTRRTRTIGLKSQLTFGMVTPYLGISHYRRCIPRHHDLGILLWMVSLSSLSPQIRRKFRRPSEHSETRPHYHTPLRQEPRWRQAPLEEKDDGVSNDRRDEQGRSESRYPRSPSTGLRSVVGMGDPPRRRQRQRVLCWMVKSSRISTGRRVGNVGSAGIRKLETGRSRPSLRRGRSSRGRTLETGPSLIPAIPRSPTHRMLKSAYSCAASHPGHTAVRTRDGIYR